MTGFDYARSAATAAGLIAKFGRIVPYQKSTPGTSGPAHDPGPETWSTAVNAVVAVLPAHKGSHFFDDAIAAGTFVVGKHRLIYLSPKLADGTPFPYEPAALDRFFFDGYHWTALGATALSPAGTVVVYTLGVERS